jgi:hypothetical protein
VRSVDCNRTLSNVKQQKKKEKKKKKKERSNEHNVCDWAVLLSDPPHAFTVTPISPPYDQATPCHHHVITVSSSPSY